MLSKRIWNSVTILLIAIVGNPSNVLAGKSSTGTRASQRSFDFTYAAKIKELPAGANVRVWIPIPPSNEHQQVKRISSSLPTSLSGIDVESKYANRIHYFACQPAKSGMIDFSVTYRVHRTEVRGLKSKVGTELTDGQRQLFLSASSKVPVGGKPVALLAELRLPKDDPLRLGQLLYNKVDDHMKYDKSQPGYGTGDATWACDSRFGNCTDFHSLFISMTRSQGVPARFEIGFPLPEKRGEGNVGGYHCWAFFHVNDHGWVPVDISEADKNPKLKKYYFGNLTENRVTFAVGRDLMLTPKQNAPPLNFFVYPHVEVDGQVWPRDKMEKRFKFKDIN